MTTDPAPTAPVRAPRSRQRFERKRDDILDAATDLINERGAKGTALLDVARAVGLNTTSVTYYFRRKDQLAAAVFERTTERLTGMVRAAAGEATPEARVRRFIEHHAELRASVLRGDARPLASLSELRALEEPLRVPLEKQYQALFREVRAFFGTPASEIHKDLFTARAHILLELVFWLPVWISQYALDDFPRVTKRLFDIVSNGIAAPGAVWRPRTLAEGADFGGGEGGRENFLRVATQLINESGYRGASVERIVEKLKVTKGSFYHHLDAKDDLVLECFRRSYKRVANMQSRAHCSRTDEWDSLSTAIASLLDIQFEASWPLTRTTALQALPVPVRVEVVQRSNRTALRFAGTLTEGASEGSLRVVDPLVASQMIIATLNSAFDLRKWASRLPRDRAIAMYASVIVDGMFDDRVLARDG